MSKTDWPDFDDVIDPETVPVPGSRPRVKHERKEREPRSELPWDAYPKTLRVDGVEREMFDAEALALALGVKNEVIKYWERKGYLPKTNVRMPTPRLRSGLYGTPVLGRRLYTRAFIEGVVNLAKDTGILDGQPIKDSGFPARALDLYYDTMPGAPA